MRTFPWVDLQLGVRVAWQGTGSVWDTQWESTEVPRPCGLGGGASGRCPQGIPATTVTGLLKDHSGCGGCRLGWDGNGDQLVTGGDLD